MKISAKLCGAFFILLLLSVGGSLGVAGDEPRVTLTFPDAARNSDENKDSPGGLHLRINPEKRVEYGNQQEHRRQNSPKSNQHVSNSQKKKSNNKKHSQNSRPQKPEKRHGAYQSGPFEISGVRIVDINSGRVMPIESVNLKPTIERIVAGIKNPHRNDGTIFRNSSHHLPRKPRNYYREYVVPTDGIRGPGPQRLVIGQEGEMYYTYDHYDTFIKVERE